MARVDELLRYLMENDGSDLHLVSGIAPRIRTKGELAGVEGWTELSDEELRETIPLGIMRELHRWGAHAMVLTVWLHMFRVFMTGSYKPPREFNWVIGVVLLLLTLLLLFSFKGEVILANPMTILWIAIPLFLQTVLIFGLGYVLAKLLKLSYRDAAPSAMIGASNHFEVAIATATMLFGLSSGAALATVVGVLIEVPVMLMLVRFCLNTQSWFK